MTNPKQISKKTGGKLIKLDRHINQSHDNMDECFDLNAENSENQNSIPEINLEDLSILKNNSIISHDSLDHVNIKKNICLSFLLLLLNNRT